MPNGSFDRLTTLSNIEGPISASCLNRNYNQRIQNTDFSSQNKNFSFKNEYRMSNKEYRLMKFPFDIYPPYLWRVLFLVHYSAVLFLKSLQGCRPNEPEA